MIFLHFIDLFVYYLCLFLSLPCYRVCFLQLVVTCWEMADLLALLYVMFSFVFVTFPYVVLGQAWYLIVSIPDICPLPYFYCWRLLFR